MTTGNEAALQGDQASSEPPSGNWSEGFVRTALGAADYHARRLGRSLGLGLMDIQDIRQDLLLEVLRRAPRFDPERASWVTFVEIVVRHAAADIAGRIVVARAVHGGSLDEVREDGLATEPAEGEGLDGIWRGAPDRFLDVERRLDVERFIAGLPDDLRRLCRLMQTESAGEAQRLSGLSPAEFYRQLQDLRMRLRSVGLG
ncbi:MAG: sigma-70 family RNA polymerase sigma factor [Rhodospirillaceae bacterium]|nr:sigma-70 family RNA polymerase sigma factor [Rhodospirillaceae bacterium]